MPGNEYTCWVFKDDVSRPKMVRMRERLGGLGWRRWSLCAFCTSGWQNRIGIRIEESDTSLEKEDVMVES